MKKVLSWLFLVVMLFLAIAPAVQAAEWWDRYYVEIESADFNNITLTYDWSCPWACNHYGQEEGYLLYIGHGATKQECRNSASANRVPNMTWSPYVYSWPFGVSQGFEPGDMACIFWCCQPIAPMMLLQWIYIDIDGAPWW